MVKRFVQVAHRHGPHFFLSSEPHGCAPQSHRFVLFVFFDVPRDGGVVPHLHLTSEFMNDCLDPKPTFLWHHTPRLLFLFKPPSSPH